MAITDLTRKELAYFILNEAKEPFLSKLKSLMQSEQLKIAGYTPNGEYITNEQMNSILAESEADYEAGRFISQKDLSEEIKNW